MINQDVSKNKNLLNMLRSNGDLKIVFQIDKIGGYISENQTISFVDGIDKVYKTIIYDYQDALYKADDYGELFEDVEKNITRLENESDDDYDKRIKDFIENNIDKEEVIIIEIKTDSPEQDNNLGMFGGLFDGFGNMIGNVVEENNSEENINTNEEGE